MKKPTAEYFQVGPSRIRAHATIYRRLRIGRDGHRDQSEAYDRS